MFYSYFYIFIKCDQLNFIVYFFIMTIKNLESYIWMLHNVVKAILDG